MKTVVTYNEELVDDQRKIGVSHFNFGTGNRIKPTIESILNNEISGVELRSNSRIANLDEAEIIHPSYYTKYLEGIFQDGGGFTGMDDESYLQPEMFKVALLSIALAKDSIDILFNEDIESVYALTLSAGHHVGRAYAGGLCFFNNVAIAAKYAREQYGVKKIMILDWDAHFCNGTTEIFKEDPDTVVVSIHEYPVEDLHVDFWNKGFVAENGNYGFSIPGPSNEDLARIFLKEFVKPLYEIHKPNMIIISAGQDGHCMDDMSSLRYSTDFFNEMALFVRGLADKTSTQKILVCLEGGYSGDVMKITNKAILQGLQRQKTHFEDSKEVPEEKKKILKFMQAYYGPEGYFNDGDYNNFPEKELVMFREKLEELRN